MDIVEEINFMLVEMKESLCYPYYNGKLGHQKFECMVWNDRDEADH